MKSNLADQNTEEFPEDPGEPAGAEPYHQVGRSSVYLVGAATFLFWLSLYLYVPVLPLHAERMGASFSMVGLIVSAYAIAQITLRIPIGVAADIVGRRKPFAVAAMILATMGALGLAVAPNPWTLFAARAVTGIGAAGWVAISVLYASYFSANRSGHAMSRVMSINGMSIVLAMFAGGLISDHFGADAAFYSGAVVGVLAVVLMLAATEPPLRRTQSYSMATFIRVARTPLLLTVGGIGVLTHFVTFGGSFGFIPLYAESIGASESEVGYIATAMLIAAVLGTLSVTRIVDRWGSRVAIFIGAAMVAVSMVLIPSTDTVLEMILLQALGGFGRGVVNTSLFALSLRSVAIEDRATAMGIFQATYAIGMMSGPIVSGQVADNISLDVVFYMVAAVSLAAGFAGFQRRIPARSTQSDDTR